jgi:hypothetical protein
VNEKRATTTTTKLLCATAAVLPGLVILSADTTASAQTYEMTTPFSPGVAVSDKIDLFADA